MPRGPASRCLAHLKRRETTEESQRKKWWRCERARDVEKFSASTNICTHTRTKKGKREEKVMMTRAGTRRAARKGMKRAPKAGTQTKIIPLLFFPSKLPWRVRLTAITYACARALDKKRLLLQRNPIQDTNGEREEDKITAPLSLVVHTPRSDQATLELPRSLRSLTISLPPPNLPAAGLKSV